MDDWSSLLPRERLSRIRTPLARLRTEANNLFLDQDIPATKLANLRASTQMPPAERAIALLDATVFGSAKHGVLFGEHALYIHNSWTVASSQHRGRIVVPYDQLATMTFEKGWLEIRFPGGAIETAGSGFSTVQMLALLDALQRSIRTGSDVDDPVGEHAGVFIAPHLVSAPHRPSDDVWPQGIATGADASIVTPPLVRRWECEIGGAIRSSPAIARDFVIVVVTASSGTQLVGLELTTGRRFWQRELPMLHWTPARSRVVIACELVFICGGGYWHAFDLETGAPRKIDTAALGRDVRDQLVLADVAVCDPASYAADPAALAHASVTPGTALQLIAANDRRRVFATPGLQARAPSIRIIDHRGTHDVVG
ncbi:MAG: hypothetical protein H0V17_02605, partial [Deltaproteobacteria bacterium]|nr:hypothetical protein [Deltaproteobacteria bacterium]